MTELSVLVLGVGGNVSQGILKALRLAQLKCRVVGACTSPLSAGLYTVDRAYVSPPAADERFLDWLSATCRAERIDAILSGVEPVLDVLAHHVEKIRQATGAAALVCSPQVLSIANDKLATARWLADRGFNFPRSADSADRAAVASLLKQCPLPLIVKPRTGKGASGVLRIDDRAQLDLFAGRPGFVVQEYLGDDESEFTAGGMVDRDGVLRGMIVMRRLLIHGTTARAEVGGFPDIRFEASRICQALRPTGPCNVQMRLSNGKPVCFEINARFSGTTGIRARFGFNDVEASLRHFVLDEPAVDLPHITSGIALRYWNEMYIDPAAHDALQRTARLDEPARHPLQVEDYGIRR